MSLVKTCSTCGQLDNEFCSNIFHNLRNGYVYKPGTGKIDEQATIGKMSGIINELRAEVKRLRSEMEATT